MKLTIGIPTANDPSGLEWTLQTLAVCHDLTDVELIVIDNDWRTRTDGKPTKTSTDARNHVLGLAGRYEWMPSPVGTAPPRNRIAQLATGDVVIVLDSHVALGRHALAAVREYFAAAEHRRDLVSGPITLKSLEAGTTQLAPFATHYGRVWRNRMEGIWQQAWRCPCGDWHFDVHYRQPDYAPRFLGNILESRPTPPKDRAVTYHDLTMERLPVNRCPKCGRDLPMHIEYSQHWRTLSESGYVPRCWSVDRDPTAFEIPGMGLGAFAFWRESWPGFPAAMVGFGGGELHLAEAFRRRGGRAVCLPDARWWHRFARDYRADGEYEYSDAELLQLAKKGRLDSPPLWWTVRNYVLWRRDLGWPTDDVEQHFVHDPVTSCLNEDQWAHLTSQPETAIEYPKHLEWADSIDAMWQEAMRSTDRCVPVLPTVRAFAERAERVTIVGRRWQWNAAVLRAEPRVIRSHSKCNRGAHMMRVYQLRDDLSDRWTMADGLVAKLDDCDLLILDTEHSESRVAAELERWNLKVRHRIAIYGTEAYGETVGDNGLGINYAIRNFCSQHPDWRVVYEDPRGSGMTVLSCHAFERPIDRGPGSQLKHIFLALSIRMPPTCSCRDMIRRMDTWGVAGCRQHCDAIADHLRTNDQHFGWRDKLTAAAAVLKTGLWKSIDWTDPFPGLIQEAIRRAEVFDREWEATGCT